MDPGAVGHRGQRFVCGRRTMFPCNPKVESSGHSAVKNLCWTSMMMPIQRLIWTLWQPCSSYSVFFGFILSLSGSVCPDDAIWRTLVWPVSGVYWACGSWRSGLLCAYGTRGMASRKHVPPLTKHKTGSNATVVKLHQTFCVFVPTPGSV